MAKLLRTSFLQSLDFKIINKKRFKLFFNIAIFLSIFAVSSSIITINYENKINKIKSKILQYHGDSILSLIPNLHSYYLKNPVGWSREKGTKLF